MARSQDGILVGDHRNDLPDGTAQSRLSVVDAQSLAHVDRGFDGQADGAIADSFDGLAGVNDRHPDDPPAPIERRAHCVWIQATNGQIEDNPAECLQAGDLSSYSVSTIHRGLTHVLEHDSGHTARLCLEGDGQVVLTSWHGVGGGMNMCVVRTDESWASSCP